MVLALIVAFAASAVVLNAYDPGDGIISDEEAAIQIAKHFILNAPTYAFDGIDGTLQLIQTTSLESWPVQHVVMLSFESSNAGYGNRSGEVLAQVVTTHMAWVKVVEGKVIQAVLDEKWDELNQRETGTVDDVPDGTILSPEDAVSRVIDFIIREHELMEIACFMNYNLEDITPQGTVGSTTKRFNGAPWTITISWQLVQFPVYKVEAEYDGSTAFQWRGTVDHQGSIEELGFELAK